MPGSMVDQLEFLVLTLYLCLCEHSVVEHCRSSTQESYIYTSALTTPRPLNKPIYVLTIVS